MKKRILIFTLLVFIIQSEAFAQNQQSEERSKQDIEKLFWARQDSATMNYTQADVDFMTGMIGHHAQALVMSALAPKNGASEAVETLAARIINAQRDEIHLMQKWLADRKLPVPQVHIEGLILTTPIGDKPMLHFYPNGDMEEQHAMKHGESDMDHDMHHNKEDNSEEVQHSEHDMSMGHAMSEDHSNMAHDHSMMPGMLTQEQLEELAAAKGMEFDRLYLRYMIQHHRGAIIMVNDLVSSPGAAQELGIGKMAGDINVDQTTEIERMRLMLAQMLDDSVTLH